MSFEQPITDVVAYRASAEEFRKWGYDDGDYKMPAQNNYERTSIFEASQRPISTNVARHAAEQAMKNNIWANLNN